MCEFDANVARCLEPIDDQLSAHITATVNSCRNPIDFTFQVQTNNSTQTWEHTFLNTNELQSIPSLWPGGALEVNLVQIHGNDSSLQAVQVVASLFVNDEEGPPFLNSTLPMSTLQCPSPGSMSSLPLILFVAILVLIAASLGAFFGRRHCKSQAKKLYADELLRNADGSAGSSHVSEGVGYYDNPVRSNTVLIQNSVYRDTVCPETPPQRPRFITLNKPVWAKSATKSRYAGDRLKSYRQQTLATVPSVDLETSVDRY